MHHIMSNSSRKDVLDVPVEYLEITVHVLRSFSDIFAIVNAVFVVTNAHAYKFMS